MRATLAQTLGVALALQAAGCAQEHGSSREREREPAAAGSDQPPPPDTKGHTGAQAFVTLTPVGELRFEGDGRLAQTTGGVDLELSLHGCEPGAAYQLLVAAGLDCSDATLRGGAWQEGAGDQLPPVTCTAFSSNQARVRYTRESRHAKPWTLGTPESSNLLGHALVLRRSDEEPLACGIITQAPDLPPVQIDPAMLPSPELSALVAGSCVWKTFVPGSTRSCPDPKELSACATEHCGLSACIKECSEYLTCMADVEDPCSNEYACEMSDACTQCRSDVGLCTFNFCTEQIACAPSSKPDGPCAQLQACCAMQGNQTASCLETVRLLERLSGDASCVGAMHDWDFNAHLPVPCKFQ